MGSFFADFFNRKGFDVLVNDIGTKLSKRKLAQKSDVIFFAVPIHLTEKVIKEVLPYTNEKQLLLDCTSIKVRPINVMMKSKASVIGLHPMFRPSPLGLKNQTIVMCVGRAQKETALWIEKLFKDDGAKITRMTPKEHDELMSVIQVLLHFHTIVLGHTMRKIGMPIKKTLAVASPIYKLEMDMIGRIFSQDPTLYGSLQMLNPQTKKIIKMLFKETEDLASVIAKKDLNKFKKMFGETSKFLGRFKDDAMEETNRLLTYIK